MKKYLNVLISGIVAGMLIGLAGTVYFMCTESRIVGAALFSIGLFLISVMNAGLYTGKVGYVIENKEYKNLGLVLLGNIIGTLTFGLLIRLTKYKDAIEVLALEKMKGKLDLNFDSILSVLILSVLCGVLMFSVYEAKKRLSDKLGQYIALFLCVMTFILSGFEHSIANVFYITVANSWTWVIVVYLIIMIIGNAIGGLLTWKASKTLHLDNLNNQDETVK